MKPARPKPGDLVARNNITEELLVTLVCENIVIRNGKGYYHTVSFDAFDTGYTTIRPAKPVDVHAWT